MSARPRILLVQVDRGVTDTWVESDPELRQLADWQVVSINRPSSLDRAMAGFRLPRLSGFDLVVSTEYYGALGAGLRLRVSRAATHHVVWGLNQSRQILDKPVLSHIAHWGFSRASMIVTHSRRETDLFVKYHALPRGIFRFKHWGFDVPPITPTAFSSPGEPYVCLVGRNNRDIRTFRQGVVAAGVRGIVISSRVSAEERSLLARDGIELHEDLDFNACLDCIRHSAASAVLLSDDLRGAGHITMVSAMQLGVPQIVTRAGVTRDYFTEEEHGIGVDLGNADQVAQAIRRLWATPETGRAMGLQAREIACRDYSHAAVVQQMRQVLVDLRLI